MSSQSTDPEAPRSRRRRPFETWRKIALGGAVVLLAGSIIDAATDHFPRIVLTLFLGVGWGLLAAGFGKFMLDRRRAAESQKDSVRP